MKQIYIEEQAKDQVHQNFRNTNSEVHCSIIRVLPNSDFLNIFLIQNKGKGPPGDILHPDHPPDGGAVLKASSQVVQCHPELVSGSFQDPNFIDVRPRNKFGVTNSDFNQILNTEIQIFNKNQNSNFLQTLNFTNMKKQILFLAFFVLAIFAGMKSYAQPIIADGNPSTYVNILLGAGANTTVTILGCADNDALHPQAGITYQYEIATSAATDQIHWFVVENPATGGIIDGNNEIPASVLTSIDAGDGSDAFILLAGTSYNTPAQMAKTVDISWKSFDGVANVVLLVAYVVDADGCTDNIQAYRILPKLNFTLDIAALDDDGTIHTTNAECASPVESAIYVPGSTAIDGDLQVNYGENWVFYTVTAANFTHSWKPSFKIDYDGTVEDEITVEWALAANGASTTAADWHATTLTAGVYVSTDAVPVVNNAGADDGTGESIVVRVRVDHGEVDEIKSPDIRTLTLSVDGTMYDPSATAGNEYSNTTLVDLSEDGTDADTNCDQIPYDDKFDYQITPRPLITSDTQFDSSVPTATPIQPFVPKNP